MAPGRADFPRDFFERLAATFGESLVVKTTYRFIATMGTVDTLDDPERWTGYLYSMCERAHGTDPSSTNPERKDLDEIPAGIQDLHAELVERERERAEKRASRKRLR